MDGIDLGADAQIDHLDEHRKGHREVDVTLWNVLLETLAEE